ncbi:MAG: isoamylase early set domain-containing protein [Phycisphaerae bacterium]|nr:isoamylase early set domain-containing protein [Gemmatimonadaceae bacterium]
MTEDHILPIDGGETPDDPQLRERLVSAYRHTPAPADSAMSRCIRAVLDRATLEQTAMVNTPVPGFARRHWAMAGVAVAAALLVTVTVRSRAPIDEVAGATDVASTAPVGSTTAVAGGVQFDLRLPADFAANVSVIGDFNGWDGTKTPMVKDQSTGEWSAKVTLLPGRHVYAYLVDGERWVVDPLAPQIPDAGYGPANAVVVEGDTR